MHRRRSYRFAVTAGLTVLGACADPSGPAPGAARRPDPVDTTASKPTPTPRARFGPILVSVFNMEQRGAPTRYPPSVRVMDDRGLPLEKVAVDFAIVLGGGSLASTQALSDANGFATAGSWRLGPTTGRNVVRVTSPSTNDTVLLEIDGVDVDTLRVADRFVLDRIDGMILPIVMPDPDGDPTEQVLLSAVVEVQRDRFAFRWTTRASGATNAVEHSVAGTIKAAKPYLEFETDGMHPLEYFRTSPAILLTDGRLRIANYAEGWPLFGNHQDFKRAP
jgi:hypothetical protein